MISYQKLWYLTYDKLSQVMGCFPKFYSFKNLFDFFFILDLNCADLSQEKKESEKKRNKEKRTNRKKEKFF